MEHFNELTPAEHERLSLLLEEMGEAQQIVGKILRHGYESRHPKGGPTNRDLLAEELGHVRHAENLMTLADDLDCEVVVRSIASKSRRVKKYLHHQE